MSRISSESLAQAKAFVEANAAHASLETARESFAALAVLDENAGLQRSLTDPARTPEERVALVEKIFSGKVSDLVLELLKTVAAGRWSSARDLTDAMETAGVTQVALVAERGGEAGLNRLEAELFAFGNTVAGSHSLQQALSQVMAPRAARRTLAASLTQSLSEEAKVLLEQAILAPRGMKVATLVERFAGFVAQRHNQWIARVESRVELTEEQKQKLSEQLNRLYGRELKINATTLPSLVGGVRVTVGDEVLDSSTATRLNQLRQRLAS